MRENKTKITLSLVTLLVSMFCMSLVAFADPTSSTPSKVTHVVQTSSSTSSFEIAWDAVMTSDTVYYAVEISTDNVNYVERESTVYSTSRYISGLNAGRRYYVRVRAFTRWMDSNYDFNNVYGEYSDPIIVVTSPDVSIKNIKETSATKNSITLTWSKVAGASGYYVYNEYPSKDTRTIAKTTKNTVTINGIKSSTANNFYIAPIMQGTTGVAIGTSTVFYNSDIKIKPANIAKKNVEFNSFYSSLKEAGITVNIQKKTDGYQVKAFKNGSKKAVFSAHYTSNYSQDIKKINENSFYKIQVRGYSVIDGKKVYSAKWTTFYIAQQSKVNLKWSGNKIKTSWKKVNGATNYIVYASTKEKSGYKKLATTKKTNYTVSKVGKKATKKGKKYYIYVVPTMKVGKTTYKANATYCYYLLR